MTRSEFGTIVLKPNKKDPKRVTAQYRTPLWVLQKWPGQPKRQSKSFKVTRYTLREAKYAAQQWLAEQSKLIMSKTWVPESELERDMLRNSITFAQYSEKWLRERTFRGRPLRPQTVYANSETIKNHLLPFFGRMRLVAINQSTIDRWLSTMDPSKPFAIKNAFKILKAILHTASQPGKNGEKPLIPKYPVTLTLSTPHRETRTIPATPEEVDAIYRAMPDKYAMAIYLAVYANGLRIGEVCVLQRGDIDLERETLTVARSRTVQGTSHVGPTKTDRSNREEDLPSGLVPLLKNFLDEYVGPGKGAWLFPEASDESIPISPNVLRHYYSKARHAAGRDDLRFHDLRHTSLTWLAQDGATTKELMDAAGHSKPEVAMRYQHATDGRRRLLADRMGDRLPADETTPEGIEEQIRKIDRRIAGLTEKRDTLAQKLKCFNEKQLIDKAV